MAKFTSIYDPAQGNTVYTGECAIREGAVTEIEEIELITAKLEDNEGTEPETSFEPEVEPEKVEDENDVISEEIIETDAESDYE